MSEIVILEWKFTPQNYFEKTLDISGNDYSMIITKGKVEARIDSANLSMRKELQDKLDSRFLVEQFFTHQAYELTCSSISRLHPDGRKDAVIEPEMFQNRNTFYSPDTILTDKNGNVISDSKQERIDEKKKFTGLAAARSDDKLLKSLLKSYDAAVHDPNKELVHLYEIREALHKIFGSEKVAREVLGITSSQWSRFGQLCNDELLRQGRHAGRNAGVLRDASEDELTEAREIVQAMIKAYILFL